MKRWDVSLLAMAVAMVACVGSRADMAAYWPLDGTIAESISGLAGSVAGSDLTPTYVSGNFGQAFDFGTGGTRYFGTHADLTTSALGIDGNKPSTVSLWIWQRSNTHVGNGPYVYSTTPSGSPSNYQNLWLWRYGSSDSDWLHATQGPASAGVKLGRIGSVPGPPVLGPPWRPGQQFSC
jgi:hypothetical protein